MGKILKVILSMSCWGMLAFVAASMAGNYLPGFSDAAFFSQADTLMHRFSMSFGGWLNDSVFKPEWPRFFREILELPVIVLGAMSPLLMPAPRDLKGMWLAAGPVVLVKYAALVLLIWTLQFGYTPEEQGRHLLGYYRDWLATSIYGTPRELFANEMIGLVGGGAAWGWYHFAAKGFDKALWLIVRIMAMFALLYAGPPIVLGISFLAPEGGTFGQNLIHAMEAWWQLVLSGEGLCGTDVCGLAG